MTAENGNTHNVFLQLSVPHIKVLLQLEISEATIENLDLCFVC